MYDVAIIMTTPQRSEPPIIKTGLRDETQARLFIAGEAQKWQEKVEAAGERVVDRSVHEDPDKLWATTEDENYTFTASFVHKK